MGSAAPLGSYLVQVNDVSPHTPPPRGAGAPARSASGWKARFARWKRLLTASVRGHLDGNGDIFAGGIAFFTALSLSPLLVLAVAMVGVFFGAEATQAHLLTDLEAAVGPEPAAVIGDLVRKAAVDEGRWWSVALAGVIAAWSATTMFANLQSTLNAMWGVKARETSGVAASIKSVLRKRITSFVLVAVIGALLFASMLAQSLGSGVAALASELPFGDWPWRLLQMVFAIAIVTAFLVPVYRVLPDVVLGWRDVWPGALLAAVLATIGAWAFGLYFGYAATGSVSGAAGSVLLLLLWMYVNSHILLLGARLTLEYVRDVRGIVEPEPQAELVREPVAA